MKNTLILSVIMGALSISSSFAAKLTLETKGEENAFKQTKLSVKAGEKVELTLKNNSTGMQHNFVLTKIGKDQSVGIASMSAGAAKGWVAETPDVIAHTKLVDAKKSDTVTFTAPAEKGDYPYICSFPGHYMSMKGVLTVK